MELYALVGRSGTGKSYKSHIVAGTYEIEYVIDDGLLIKGTKIIAGISAKREKTKFGAVRRAIFKYDKHREEVKAAITHYSPSKLLIIGTSEHMIQSIIKALELTETYKLIKIEDISTAEEIEIACNTRKYKGKHVIPVPTFEIKKAFSGYFIDSIKHWTRRNDKTSSIMTGENEISTVATAMTMSTTPTGVVSGLGASSFVTIAETTVVRPTFSYLGNFEIKDAAVKAIIEEATTKVNGIFKVNSVELKNQVDGIKIYVTVILNCKTSIPVTVDVMAKAIKENVEHMTGFNVLEINTIVKALVFGAEK